MGVATESLTLTLFLTLALTLTLTLTLALTLTLTLTLTHAGRRHWNMVYLALEFCRRARFLGVAACLKSWAPFVVLFPLAVRLRAPLLPPPSLHNNIAGHVGSLKPSRPPSRNSEHQSHRRRNPSLPLVSSPE